MKRICALLLALVIVFGLMPVTARAASQENGLLYEVNGNSVTITGYTGNPRTLTIPTKIAGKPVTAIGDKAFYDCNNLIDVTIPKGVTHIGRNAFGLCEELVSIHLPDGLTYIGDHAFYFCSSLDDINIPTSVTHIGNFAFVCCGALPTLYIPEGITRIGNYTFNWCTHLDNITIPSSVTEIGQQAFEYCQRLNYVCFKGNAPRIHETAFNNATTTAYYPTGNPTWTDDVMQDYGGNITWVPYFADVPMNTYYAKPVLWAVENGITDGTSDTTFSPNNKCLRSQVVTFLHRAEKNPAPSSTRNPFSDVKTGDYFYKPVLWAVEKGITDGVADNRFGSNDVCTRGQVVTFLWRAAGEPKPQSTRNPFKDVKSTDYFYKPVLWAVENGITDGVEDNRFGSNDPCTRAQVVTFLYRASN